MNLVTWLLSLVGPLASKALLYLGITAVTLSGVQTAFGLLLAHMQSGYSGMPSDVVALAGLAGMPDALGLIWGAFNARLAIWVTLNSTRWVTSK